MVAYSVAFSAGGNPDFVGEVPAYEAPVARLDADIIFRYICVMLAPFGRRLKAASTVAVVAHPARHLRARLVAPTTVLLPLRGRLQDAVWAAEIRRVAARLRAHTACEVGEFAVGVRVAPGLNMNDEQAGGEEEDGFRHGRAANEITTAA